LEATILDRAREADMKLHSVMVFPSETLGWEADFMAVPGLVRQYTAPFKGIVQQLREEFDLAE
jgi:hypothetical protein